MRGNKVVISKIEANIPIPEIQWGNHKRGTPAGNSRYPILKLKPQESFAINCKDLKQAKGIRGAVREQINRYINKYKLLSKKTKFVIRTIDNTTIRVWRTK